MNKNKKNNKNNIKRSKPYTQTQVGEYLQNQKPQSYSNNSARGLLPHQYNHMVRGCSQGRLSAFSFACAYPSESESPGEQTDNPSGVPQTSQEY